MDSIGFALLAAPFVVGVWWITDEVKRHLRARRVLKRAKARRGYIK